MRILKYCHHTRPSIRMLLQLPQHPFCSSSLQTKQTSALISLSTSLCSSHTCHQVHSYKATATTIIFFYLSWKDLIRSQKLREWQGLWKPWTGRSKLLKSFNFSVNFSVVWGDQGDQGCTIKHASTEKQKEKNPTTLFKQVGSPWCLSWVVKLTVSQLWETPHSTSRYRGFLGSQDFGITRDSNLLRLYPVETLRDIANTVEQRKRNKADFYWNWSRRVQHVTSYSKTSAL